MAELTEELKTELVQRIARFERPAECAKWLKTEHDIVIGIPQILAYDPSKPYFRAGEKWRTLFDVTREGYLYEVAKVPIAQQGFRLNVLNTMLQDALAAKNRGQALDILEQAAKEVGGLFSNVRVNVPLGGGGEKELGEDERRAALAGIIDNALRRPNAPASSTTQ